MNIKKFESFKTKSGELYDYGCVMVYLNISNWDNIVSKIDESDLYQPNNQVYGYETSPHVTILYGLHSDVEDSDVINIFKNKSIKEICVDGIGVFPGEEFDVVKMNIESDILTSLNSKLMKLPNSNDYPDYIPHVTIAYILPGKGKKYVDNKYQHTFTRINKVVYEKTNGEKIEIPIN